MKTVSIAELKNKLSAIIAKLESWQSVTITDRNVPIAVLYPYGGGVGDDAGRLTRLERSGVIARPARGGTPASLKGAPVALSRPTDAVAVLLAERRGGR